MDEPLERRLVASEHDLLVSGRPLEPAGGRSGRSFPRLFGSPAFFRLWLAQVVSATGDWLGLVAIIALADRVGGDYAGASIGLVLAARIVPGFFLAPLAGVLVDRWDRKKVMVACDLGRAAVMLSLPFVDSIGGLVVASLVLEVFTLLWSPAKEATVPNLVPRSYLTTANSLSLVAAYGTFPDRRGAVHVLAKLEGWLDLDRASLAFQIERADVPRHRRHRVDACRSRGRRADVSRRTTERRFDAIRDAARAPRGLALHLHQPGRAGGQHRPGDRPHRRRHAHPARPDLRARTCSAPAMPATARSSPRSASAWRSACWPSPCSSGTCRRSGCSRWPCSSPGSRSCIAASSSTLTPAVLAVGVIGVCAGTVYVLGFTLLHENVDDELRGRVFTALYTLVRLCLLIAMTVGPLLTELLDQLSTRWWQGDADLFGVQMALPGVRLTLWLAGAIILVAGWLAAVSLARRRQTGTVGTSRRS